MKRKSLTAFGLIFMLTIASTGCSGDTTIQTSAQSESSTASTTGETTGDTTQSEAAASTVVPAADITYEYKEEELSADYDATNACTITLNETAATIDGDGATASDGIITIQSGGTYILSGTLSSGQIQINAGKQDVVRVVLNNASINCENSSAIYGIQSDKIILTLAEGSSNTLSDGASYVYEDTSADEPNAALFSKDDLIINGSGELTVTGNYQDGIRSKDDLRLLSGTLTVTAVQDGAKGKDSVIIKDSDLTVTAGDDGIKSTNIEDSTRGYVLMEGGSATINSGNDGIQAETILKITNGDVNITTTGDPASESAKGLKCTGNVYLTGGTYAVTATDDTIHSNENVTITGGSYTLASGDDGIHADANLTISEGTIHITKSFEGLEGLSIDIKGGDITLLSEDDGLNAAGGNDNSAAQGRFGADSFASDDSAYIRIEGGTLLVNAEGDGIDSNGAIYITGGTTTVYGPVNGGNGSLDFGGTGEISGGTLIAVGSAQMAQTLSASSTQNFITANFTAVLNGGTGFTLTDQNGTELCSLTPDKNYQNVIISSPDLKTGSTYTLASTSGEEAGSVTIEAIASTIGTVTGGMGGGGGGMGGGKTGGERPEKGTAPEGGTMPEGMTPPEDGTMPEGMTPPEDGTIPENMTPTEETQSESSENIDSAV